MRSSLLLVVIVGLFAASQALDFSNLKEVGTSLVNGLISKLKDVAVQAGQSLLSKLTGMIGKRELLDGKSAWIEKLKAMWADKLEGMKKKKEELAKNFGSAMDKLKALREKWHAKLGFMKDTKKVDESIDKVVAEHKEEHKRIIGDLIQKGKDLFASAVAAVKSGLSGLKDKASQLVSGLLQKGTDLVLGKRATLGNHLQRIGGAISSAVSPFKDIVAGLGSTLKGHFSNLIDTVKGHVNTLKGKLSGHVDDIKKHGKTLLDHGKNALGALSEVVGDILKQTISNAQPAIDGLAKTAADAGGTVLNHFTGGN